MTKLEELREEFDKLGAELDALTNPDGSCKDPKRFDEVFDKQAKITHEIMDILKRENKK